jgi:hypothetical protein
MAYALQKASSKETFAKENKSSESTIRELPEIRRMFGMCYAFPTNKSGFWKDEVLPEEVMAELRRPSKDDAVTSSFREKQREAARRRSDADAKQFEAVRRKSKELTDKMQEDIMALTNSKINRGSFIVGA